MSTYNEKTLKKHKKTINGIKVIAYNDSNAFWCVQAGNMEAQQFDKRKWTMKDAMELAAAIAV